MKQDPGYPLVQDCPCTNLKCPRHSNCFECNKQHRKLGKLTVCMRIVAARLHDKSAEKFIKTIERYKKKYASELKILESSDNVEDETDE
jgi:hypothetical protein